MSKKEFVLSGGEKDISFAYILKNTISDSETTAESFYKKQNANDIVLKAPARRLSVGEFIELFAFVAE